MSAPQHPTGPPSRRPPNGRITPLIGALRMLRDPTLLDGACARDPHEPPVDRTLFGLLSRSARVWR